MNYAMRTFDFGFSKFGFIYVKNIFIKCSFNQFFLVLNNYIKV